MKKLGLVLFTVFLAMSQVSAANVKTVTTVLNSPDIDIDDALAFDSKGNLYGSHFSGSTVYKITADGEATAFVTGLLNPNGLAFDSSDNLFVVEYGTGVIHKYDKNGIRLNSFNVGGYPSGMIKDYASDAMIFTDVWSNSINKLSDTGEVTVLYAGAPLNVPVGLTFDRSGRLYIGNYIGREIYTLSKHDTEVTYVATVPDSGTDFPYLAFLAYANGSLYATVYGEHKIYRIHPRKTDQTEVFAGSVYGDMDGSIEEATFAYPAGIVANRSGNEIYVSEYSGLGNVRKLTRGNNKSPKVGKFNLTER